MDYSELLFVMQVREMAKQRALQRAPKELSDEERIAFMHKELPGEAIKYMRQITELAVMLRDAPPQTESHADEQTQAG